MDSSKIKGNKNKKWNNKLFGVTTPSNRESLPPSLSLPQSSINKSSPSGFSCLCLGTWVVLNFVCITTFLVVATGFCKNLFVFFLYFSFIFCVFLYFWVSCILCFLMFSQIFVFVFPCVFKNLIVFYRFCIIKNKEKVVSIIFHSCCS